MICCVIYLVSCLTAEEEVLYSATGAPASLAAGVNNAAWILGAAVVLGALYLVGKFRCLCCMYMFELCVLIFIAIPHRSGKVHALGGSQDKHSYVEIPSLDTDCDTHSTDSSVGTENSSGNRVGTRFP